MTRLPEDELSSGSFVASILLYVSYYLIVLGGSIYWIWVASINMLERDAPMALMRTPCDRCIIAPTILEFASLWLAIPVVTILATLPLLATGSLRRS